MTSFLIDLQNFATLLKSMKVLNGRSSGSKFYNFM